MLTRDAVGRESRFGALAIGNEDRRRHPAEWSVAAILEDDFRE